MMTPVTGNPSEGVPPLEPAEEHFNVRSEETSSGQLTNAQAAVFTSPEGVQIRQADSVSPNWKTQFRQSLTKLPLDRDWHSHSEPDRARVHHMDIVFDKIDWEKKSSKLLWIYSMRIRLRGI